MLATPLKIPHNAKMLWFLSVVINWTLDPNNFYQTVNDNVPVLVRFSSQHSSRSLQLEKDWNYLQKQYEENENIKTAHVNCGKYRRLCVKEGEWDTPQIHLYFNNSIKKYNGGMSHDSLERWIYKNTGIVGKNIGVDLLSPNNRTFHELLRKKTCLFTYFHNSKNTEKDLSELNKAAAAFHRERSIGIAEIDVNKFKSFIFDMKIVDYPTTLLFVDNESIPYKSYINAHDIVAFVDDYCAVFRDENGFLSNKAGIVEEVEEAVEKFMKSPKYEFIDSIKCHDNTETYVEVMKNVISRGNDWLISEESLIEEKLKEYEHSCIESDQLQIRLNIISLFVSFM